MDKKDPLALNLDPVESNNSSDSPKSCDSESAPAEPQLSLPQKNSQLKANATQDSDNQLTCTLLKELIRLLQPKPFYRRHPIIFFGFLFLVGVLLFNMFSPMDNPITETNRIAVVNIKGSIGEVEPMLKWIEKIKKTESVKGVLLRINSPGGGVGASQELYSALAELGQKKHVVASLGATAASGGLMVAMAAEHIVANPSTITGSIGVRMDIPQIFKLLNSLGISQETLVTGKFKDAASMMRELSPEDRKYLQGILQNLYDQFVELIAKSRKLTLGEVQKIADGRIFTGLEAQKLGLVDTLGGQSVALAKLRELTGVSDEDPLYERPKDMEELYEDFFRNTMEFILETLQSKDNKHEFLYK